ncbi:MAG: hypothetical protein N3E49_09480 [Bacteroidia bacterium]|nr:hypothetical protein [Bacteroidia bacterium]
MDDASAYLRGVVADHDIRDAVVSARHRAIDLIFVYHNVGQTPPFLFSLADLVIFFKISDSPEAIKSKLGYDPELLKTALHAITLKKYQWTAYNLNTHKRVGYAYL